MRHRRYMIKTLTTSGKSIPEVGGDLIVAASDGSSDIDWELIFRSRHQWEVHKAPYDLEMAGPEGAFEGPAILVRSDGRSHVFRGVGTLVGFDPNQFQDPVH